MMNGAAVRSELAERVAELRATAAGAPATILAHELDEVRALAQRHGLHAVAAVAHLIGLAVSAGGQRTMVGEWLVVLDDAIGSARHDRDAAHAYAGACSVRLAG